MGTAASESSFKRVLERAGLTEPRRRRQPAAASGRWERAPRPGANEVWTVDFKGWWYDPQGKRCEPLTVRDEHSRYLLDCAGWPTPRPDGASVFERLFDGTACPRPSAATTGRFRASEGRTGLSELSPGVALGSPGTWRPGHPQDNGGHERCIGTSVVELSATGSGGVGSVAGEFNGNGQRSSGDEVSAEV